MAIRLVVVAGILGIVNGVLPIAAPVDAATDKLPDLKVAKMTGFRIQKTASGRRLLRFNGEMVNVGRGPFEIRGRRASTKKPWIIDQVVYRTGGGTRRIRTTATMRYAGDGHNHWHIRRMLSYHIWSTHGTSRDAKIGFCFFDTNRRHPSLPGAAKTRKYGEAGCGKRGSLHTKTGISVGWGDLYPAAFAFQWIDVTGMPAGTYTVRASVDLYGKFKESSETNNCKWARISFKGSGSKVKVLASGTSCVNDHDSTPYKPDIDWALAAKVATNCDADMFCTYDFATRGELASFVARAMDLPATDQDFFTDDNGTSREADINRAAAAGLFLGCDPRKFCPNGKVTRGSMAAVLARALALPPAENDHFTDDNGTSHEAAINAVAEAGIMAGCTATTFCPSGKIRRGQTIRLVHTTLAAEPPAPPAADAGSGLSASLGPTLAGLHLASVGYKAARATGVAVDDDATAVLRSGGSDATASWTTQARAAGSFQRCVIIPSAPVDTG
jgi:hypothetical protein